MGCPWRPRRGCSDVGHRRVVITGAGETAQRAGDDLFAPCRAGRLSNLGHGLTWLPDGRPVRAASTHSNTYPAARITTNAISVMASRYHGIEPGISAAINPNSAGGVQPPPVITQCVFRQ
jgi:hypothetical protein